MKRQLLVEHVSMDELVSAIKESLKDSTQKDTKKTTNNDLDFLTREETAELFKVTFQTLNQWAKKGVLIPFKVGTRVYYNKKDIIESKKYSNLGL